MLKMEDAVSGLPRRAAPHAGRVLLVEMAVAEVTGVGLAGLASGQRGDARTAKARQMAIYLCHTTFHIPQHRLARMFGRDRTTVRHALQRIEDLRENAEFDRLLAMLEASLCRAGDGP